MADTLTAYPNGLDTHTVRDGVKKSSTYTVVINADCGKTFYITESTTFTLPAIAVGNTFTFVNQGEDGKSLLTISPNSSDAIGYRGSAVDNKDLINTLATMKKGDSVTLASLDQLVSWQVTQASGIWAKEA